MTKKVVWIIEATEHLNKRLKDYLAGPKSIYKTRSEFVRDVVRKKLKELQQK